MNPLFSFFAGLLVGLGIIVSNLANPAKVLSFLDLAGNWDPSLAFLMLTAILVTAIGFWIARSKTHAYSGQPFTPPQVNTLSPPLFIGSIAFGVGWGLLGVCPGPAVILSAVGSFKAAIFLISMVTGMFIQYRLTRQP